MLTTRYQEALAYSSKLHKDQVRKGKNTPYIAHLLSVSALVLEAGGDEDQAIAALLHDAAEAYTGDMVTPMKDLLEVRWVDPRDESRPFADLEGTLLHAIHLKLRVGVNHDNRPRPFHATGRQHRGDRVLTANPHCHSASGDVGQRQGHSVQILLGS